MMAPGDEPVGVHQPARDQGSRSADPARWELVERLRSRREFPRVKVSPLLVLARACMLAMRRTRDQLLVGRRRRQEVVYKVRQPRHRRKATLRGLVVPNVGTPSRCRCSSSPRR